jgi:hypothetical protein
MLETPKTKQSFLGQVIHFYFAPELRSLFTVLFLGIFGYFTLYYMDNLFLAIKFLIYVIKDETALQSITYLFSGMVFLISLLAPFFISFYSIFVLFMIWHKPHWATYVKWFASLALVVMSVVLILFADEAVRLAARQDVMRSFVEDANIGARI